MSRDSDEARSAMKAPIAEILLAGPRGFCAGVERAIDIVELALSVCKPPVYVRREIVHNRLVVETLRQQGAIFVDELDEVPDDATVIFSAHGISPEERREGAAVKRLSNDVDLLLVIGSANSSNAIRLVEVARTAGTRAHLINDVGDIRPEWLESARRVGITAGASTPEVLVTQTVEALRGQGVAVREVHVVEEDVRFALPQELARMAEERGMTLPARTAMRQTI